MLVVKRLPQATSFWPLLFLIGVLTLNSTAGVVAEHIVGLDDRASLEYGGPIPDSIQESGFAVAGTIVGDDAATQVEAIVLEGMVTGASDPLTNLTPLAGGLSKYRVRQGDTLSSIAGQFNISIDTIRWANSGVTWSVRKGQELTILPVTGVLYSVHEGDTLESVVARFQADPDLVRRYNAEYQEIFAAESGLVVLPNVKPPKGMTASSLAESALPDLKNYFALPAKGWNWGELHDHNAVDIANKCGSQVFAAADGVVVPDERFGDGTSGWNEGYGMFVLVEHMNGTKTRYAHLGSVSVKIGQVVGQGEEIGLIGNTGNTHGPTGCHVHFEVYGAKNPFAVR
jgi:murein DD-endopeptidase MepM/ murein hydrolase activator NlpD